MEKRVLLKISGESLAGKKGYGIDEKVVSPICQIIKKCHETGVEIAIVVGGGNYSRGRELRAIMDDCVADSVGMLATVMNALTLGSMLQKAGVSTKVFSAMEITGIAEGFSTEKALKHINNGSVVVLGGGIGQPFVTSDTAVALRSLELSVDAILWGKIGVDGVYTADPRKDKNARLIGDITYGEILSLKLDIIDLSAASLLVKHKIPSHVFDITDAENIYRIINGDQIGTIVKGGF